MADFVYQVTIEGRDVLNETDPKNRIYDSELNQVKTSDSDSFEQTVASGSTATVTVAHGLGYKPLVLAYFRDTSNSKWLVPVFQPEVTNTRQSILISVSVHVDDTNVYFVVSNQAGGSKTVEVQYEIFYEGDA